MSFIIQMGKLKSKEDIILMKSVLMMLKSFKSRLENGEDGMKMARKNMLNILTKKVKMMVFLFIGIKTELRLGSGTIKMGKKMAPLKYGSKMEKNLKTNNQNKKREKSLFYQLQKMALVKKQATLNIELLIEVEKA